MKIQFDNFRIVTLDQYSLAIEQFVEIENPKTKTVRTDWNIVGYYGNIKQCLSALAIKSLNDSKDAKDLLAKINRLEDWINEIVPELKPLVTSKGRGRPSAELDVQLTK